jgi:hypothetical protein
MRKFREENTKDNFFFSHETAGENAKKGSPAGYSFITVLIIFIAVSNYIWLKADMSPQRWDESRHLITAASLHKTITSNPAGIFKAFITADNYYPPLVPFIASFFGFTGMEQDNFTYSMILFQALLVIFVYLYAKTELDELSAMTACAVAAAYPLIFGEGHYFMLDVPLAAFYIMTLYLLKKTDHLRGRLFSAVFGAVAGLAMLVKWTYILYLLPPLALFVYSGIKEKRFDRAAAPNALLAALGCFIIAAPWYLYNLVPVLVNTFKYAVNRGAVEHLPPVLSFNSAFLYPGTLWNDSGLFFILFAAASVLLFVDRQKRGLFVVFLVSLVIFTLIPNKKNRYIIPLLPLCAVIISCIVHRIKKHIKIKAAAAFLITGAAFVNYFCATYALPFSWPNQDRPQANDWGVREYLDKIQKDRRVTLAIVPDHPFMNNSTYNYYTSVFYPNISISGIYNFPMFDDYFLVKEGDMGPDFSGLDKRQKITAEALAENSRLKLSYEKVYGTKLPDGSYSALFKRKERVKVDEASFAPMLNENIASLTSAYLKEAHNFVFKIEREQGQAEIKKIVIKFSEGIVGDFAHKPTGLKVRNIDIRINNLLLSPDTGEDGKVKILSCGGIEIVSMQVSQEDIKNFAMQYAKKLKNLDVTLDKGVITASGIYGKTPVLAAVTLYNPHPGGENSDVCFKIIRLKYGFLSVPARIADFILKDYNPLLNRSGAPVKIKYGDIKVENGFIKIQ